LPGDWLVGGEDVVEGAVFSDDHNDVLDRRSCKGLSGRGGQRRSEIGDDGEKADANNKMLPGLRQETRCRHGFSSCESCTGEGSGRGGYAKVTGDEMQVKTNSQDSGAKDVGRKGISLKK
jgi:hypothetical protein